MLTNVAEELMSLLLCECICPAVVDDAVWLLLMLFLEDGGAVSLLLFCCGPLSLFLFLSLWLVILRSVSGLLS
jgi:hypothetical protein